MSTPINNLCKYQVLARRYRPQAFRDVIGQDPAVTTLKNALRFDRAAHAYLFCGSRGVGKTTLARLFAKALNCQARSADLEPCNQCPSCLEIGAGQSLDVIEIDGASHRGIDDVRQITETACYSPAQGRYKIYIIDEVHMLTKEAFNALLKTLEEPPEKAKFLFATTEPHKVLPTIISRCQRFDLGRIQLSEIIAKLEQIAADLGRSAEPEALHLIASFSDGSLRDAESLFDQILCFSEIVTADTVRKTLGLIPQEQFFALDAAFSKANAAFAFELVDSLFTAGKDLGHFFEQLIEHIRLITIARISGESALRLPPDLSSRYIQSSQAYAPSQCLYLLDYLLRIESQLQKSACQRVALEAALLHYIQSKNRIPVEVLIRRLSELEQRGALPADAGHPKGIEANKEAPQTAEPIPAAAFKGSMQAQDEKPEIKPILPTIAPNTAEPIPAAALKDPVDAQDEKPEIRPPLPTIAPDLGRAPLPPATKQEDFKAAKIPPAPKKAALQKNEEPDAKPIPQKTDFSTANSTAGIDKAAKTRQDTLMRFAAVELEGTLK